MNHVAPASRTWRRVAKSIVSRPAIALGLVPANTSMAEASTVAAGGGDPQLPPPAGCYHNADGSLVCPPTAPIFHV